MSAVALAYIAVGFVLAFILFVEWSDIKEHLRSWWRYRKIGRRFSSIDNSLYGDSYDSLKKIREFYSDGNKAEPYLKDGSLLLRKAHLLNHTVEKGAFKEIMLAFLSVVLGGFGTRIFEIMLAAETQKDEDFLGVYISAAVVVLIIIALNIVKYSFESSKAQIYKYEISLIDKALEEGIKLSEGDSSSSSSNKTTAAGEQTSKTTN